MEYLGVKPNMDLNEAAKKACEPTCDHVGFMKYIETSLMSDMTMETVGMCSKCKEQVVIKGGVFTPINENRYVNGSK